MAEITASMVKELREATGLGMMECKKALVETNGDFKAAEELMRIKSGAKASKAASRVTAEGVIGSFLAADGKTGLWTASRVRGLAHLDGLRRRGIPFRLRLDQNAGRRDSNKGQRDEENSG